MIARQARSRLSRGNLARSIALLFAMTILLTGSVGCQESTLPAASQPRGDVSVSSSLTGSTTTTTASGAATAAASTTSTGSTSRTASSTTTAARPRPAVIPRGGIRDITFDNVKLNMKKGDPYAHSLITPEIEKLDGARVRVRGYILPPFQQTGLKRFVLVRDNMSCCFGPGAMIFDSMIVELKPGLTVDYTVAPVAVEGVFNIREVEGLGGKMISIYHVAADKVQ